MKKVFFKTTALLSVFFYQSNAQVSIPGGSSGIANSSTSILNGVSINADFHVSGSRTRLAYMNTYSDNNVDLLWFNAWHRQNGNQWGPQRLGTGYVGGIMFGKAEGGMYFNTSSSSSTAVGDFPVDNLTRLTITRFGNIGIGTTTPVARLHVDGLTVLGPDPGAALMTQLNNCANLAVGGSVPPLRLFANGTIGCTELRVNPTSWCDYVFDKNYKLKDLKDVEAFIDTTKHLPDVPSEKEVQDNGVQVSEMLKTHMRKIEELTLYLIEQNKKIEKLSTDNQKLVTEIADLKKVVDTKE